MKGSDYINWCNAHAWAKEMEAERDRYRQALEKANAELIEIADATESHAMAEDIDGVRALIKDALATTEGESRG